MIFVTGGTGLLGNCVVRELCLRGLPTRVLCRKGTPRTAFDGLDVEIVEGDLDLVEVLEEAIEGCEAVIHSAAMIHIGWSKLSESRAVNVEGTRRIASLCRTHGVRLVHVSTVDTLPAAVDRDSPVDERGLGGVPKTPCSYVISKVEAERVVRDMLDSSELDAVIIHPGFMLGPNDWKPSSGRMMLEVNRIPVVAAPPGGCSLCDARDVAAAIVNSIQSGERGENYILAGENLTYQELWQHMLNTTGRRRRVFKLGSAVQWIGTAIDLANKLLPIREGDVNGAAIAMGGLNHYYDSTRAQRVLGYQRRPIEQTLHDAWEWLSNR